MDEDENLKHVEDVEMGTVSKDMSKPLRSKETEEEQSPGSSVSTREKKELETLQQQLDIEVRLPLISVELKLDL